MYTSVMVRVREMGAEDVEAGIALVLAVFREFVRPDLGAEGWTKLLEYIDVGAARTRNEVDHRTFVAEAEDEIVGLIETRMAKHISLLVVDPRYFGRGVARKLFERALQYCRSENPELESLTVHSSRYAIAFYERLGFEAIGEETSVDGIVFTPMAFTVNATS